MKAAELVLADHQRAANGPGTAQGSYTRPSPALRQNPRKENRQ